MNSSGFNAPEEHSGDRRGVGSVPQLPGAPVTHGSPSADGKWVGLSSQDGSAKESRILSGLVLSCDRGPRVEWRDDVCVCGGVAFHLRSHRKDRAVNRYSLVVVGARG